MYFAKMSHSPSIIKILNWNVDILFICTFDRSDGFVFSYCLLTYTYTSEDGQIFKPCLSSWLLGCLGSITRQHPDMSHDAYFGLWSILYKYIYTVYNMLNTLVHYGGGWKSK